MKQPQTSWCKAYSANMALAELLSGSDVQQHWLSRDMRFRASALEYQSAWRRQGVNWGVYAKDARWKRRERLIACIKSVTAWGKAIEKLGDVASAAVVSLDALAYCSVDGKVVCQVRYLN